ncbi:MAG TPA: class I SAM-dependent methyltransferase, partial [Kofleriaceae bacterium]|nr:class I SAM-dependent methyltransferase [Kofleriaceae bacterium]
GADDYDRLVSAEDADRRLLPAISALVQLDGARVLEVGVGTGRVTELLVGAGARVVGYEPATAMLEVARRKLERFGDHGCELRALPVQEMDVPDGAFDLAIAGWVLGHFVEWFAPRWREEIGAALDRMDAALVPGGVLVIIETLGTGQTEPAPPTPGLADYYEWLERERGFRRSAIRTDYVFPDADTAASVTGAFFGAEFADRVRAQGWARVPECTGVWSRTRE